MGNLTTSCGHEVGASDAFGAKMLKICLDRAFRRYFLYVRGCLRFILVRVSCPGHCFGTSYAVPRDFWKMSIFENFMKYSSWWGFRPRKITNFLRWREFHCLAAPRFILHVTRAASARRVIRRQWATWPRLAVRIWWRSTILDRKLSRFHYKVCPGII